MWQYAVFVLLAGRVFAESSDKYRDVKIAQGMVRGHFDPEEGLYSFYDIPYATAPTGTNKFKAPLDPPVWTETLDAVDRGIVCPQPGGFLSYLTMQEDCLVASIFVPETDSANVSVVVYVHGGGYQYEYANSDKFNTLVRTEKFIVVTFNYRLGAHGFLCLGTEEAPGNAGLKDQVALLRWVQTNIASFGGNPDDVTLLGCSAGSGSIDALTISRITTGLFKKAIMNSGVSFGATGLQIEPIVNAQNYAKLLNFNNVDDLDALEEFYKTASLEMLYSQQDAIIGNENTMVVFAPCVERDVGEERVLTDAPINIIQQGNYNSIPLLFGFAEMEGSMWLWWFDTWKNKMNENFAEFLPAELYFESKEIEANVAQKVKSFYFGDNPVSKENVVEYINYFTDISFGYPMLKALAHRVESQNDTIYLFEYSFVDENSPEIPHTDVKGAGHCDQSIKDTDKSNASAEYIQMKAILREYWTNFILTGSPSVAGSTLVSWPRANASGGPYMSLGRTIELKNNLLAERVALWDSIYEEYYRAPMPPTGSAVSHIICKLIVTCSIMLFHLLF